MDPARIALYRSLAPLAPLRARGAELLAAAHPGLVPDGTLSAPQGDPAGFDAVIEAGEAWLRQRGCARALAPMEVCTWFPYRACLGPWQRAPFPLEPMTRPEPWLERGYQAVAHYDSQLVPHQPQLSRLESAAARVAAAGLRVRPMDPGDFEAELRRAWEVSLAAFEGAYAYVPLPWEAFRALYLPYRAMLDPRLVFFAEDGAGRVAGFAMTYPEAGEGGERAVVYKTLAVHPRAQRCGLGRHLLACVHRAAMAQGLGGGLIHALMWQGSASQRMAVKTGRVIREYALLGRGLG